MKKALAAAAAALLIVSALGTGTARAQVHGHPMMLRWLFSRILEPQQKAHVRSLLASERGTLVALHLRLRKSRQKLMDDLLAGKDTSADAREISAVESELLAERIKIAKAVTAGLTPAQRQRIEKFLVKWRALREQQAKLFREFGKPAEGSPPGRVGQAAKPAPEAKAANDGGRLVSSGGADNGR